MSTSARLVFPLLLSLLIISISCTNVGGNGSGAFQDFRIKVDSSKLGEEVSIGHVALRVPKEWQNADDNVRELAAKVLGDGDESSMQRALVMYKPTGQSLMAGRLHSVSGSPPQDFEGWVSGCRSGFQQTHVGASFSEARLRVNGTALVQLFAADSVGVHFRLFLDSSPQITLDYLLPQSSLETDLGAVESSIGTIHKI